MSACGGGSGCSPALSLPTALGCLSRLTWLRSPASGPQAPPSARPRRGPVACGVHVVPGAVPASDRSPTRSRRPEWHTHDSGVPVGWPRGLCASPAGLSAHANSPGLTRQVRAGSLSTRAPPARLTLRQVQARTAPSGHPLRGFRNTHLGLVTSSPLQVFVDPWESPRPSSEPGPSQGLGLNARNH